jgi:hypothetical protein
MDKTELITAISRKMNIGVDQAEIAVNHVITEMVSPEIFGLKGEMLMKGENRCTNNCKAEALEAMARTQIR